MLKQVKHVTLQVARQLGLFSAVGLSRWRQDALLIIAFHSMTLDEEHRWRRALYFTPEEFERRIRLLQRSQLNVLPLDEAIDRLHAGRLPPRSAVLTFDDGQVDFLKVVWPLLKQVGYPATVYTTTYYSEKRVPIFPMMCEYLLWKGRGQKLSFPEFGWQEPERLAAESEREAIAERVLQYADRARLDATARDQLLETLAHRLDIDYQALRSRRVLQVMTLDEIRDVSRAGADIQLHTHRHRTPHTREAFVREIVDNRARLEAATGRRAVHFCYPYGAYAPEFLPWLEELGVKTATTCEPRLATKKDPLLLLPRFVDTASVHEVEVEGWLSGFSQILPRGRAQGAHRPMPGPLPAAR